MMLTLEVIGDQAQNLGTGGRKVFNAIGGTIGRLPDNDWVFPDPYVSGRHALIRYLNGNYFIEDTSTNGVFVNALDNRVSRTRAYQLRDGDVIYIDAYRIKVSIARDSAAAHRDDPLAPLQARRKGAGAREIPPPAADGDRTASMAMRKAGPRRSSDDSLAECTEWFGMNDMTGAQPVLPLAQDHARPEPVRPTSASSRAPERRTTAAAAAPLANASSSRASSPAAEDEAQLEAVLEAAGLAFESLLAQLDPNRLQDDFDRQIRKGSILGVPAKLRYWDLYREKYAELAKDAQAAFRTQFGDAFVKAYEEQLERLHGAGRRDK